MNKNAKSSKSAENTKSSKSAKNTKNTKSAKNTPLVLLILDGWGQALPGPGNAVELARKPALDYLKQNYSHAYFDASGISVGLPEGQMGNSEVGHTNIGAGRVVFQDLSRIDNSIADGSFFKNEVFKKSFENVLKNDSSLHLAGLVSYGGVHSNLNHLKALVKYAKKFGISKIYIHAFLDGRDVLPTSGIKDLNDLNDFLKEEGAGTIATVCGRYYAMDRDKRWERTKIAYDALVFGKGDMIEYTNDFNSALLKSYESGITDEFVKPLIICKPEIQSPNFSNSLNSSNSSNSSGSSGFSNSEKFQESVKKSRIHDSDSVIFFNFRPDRARQITYSLVNRDFSGFDRKNPVFPNFTSMTQYDEKLTIPVAFPPEQIVNSLGEVLSRNGLSQLRIAETEKYAHVTFFLNGGLETPFEGEKRILIPSPKVATYDLKPEMSAFEVKDALISELESGAFDLVVCNFANMDMVGHTGIIDASVKAVEAVDFCVGEIYKKVKEMSGILIVTADHGNAECLIDPETGGPFTSHTTNPVLFILADISKNASIAKSGGKLCDIAPTILDLMNLEKPKEMSGISLVKYRNKK